MQLLLHNLTKLNLPLQTKKKQGKWVQAKTGTVLTIPAVIKPLQEEAEVRKAKKKSTLSNQSLLLTADSEA